MDPIVCQRVSINSRLKAEQYFAAGRIGRAFSHFLVALKLNPAWKTELKIIFHRVLCLWTNKLKDEGRADDASICFTQAISVFPENELIYNSYGLFFLSYNLYGAVQAISNFRKCLTMDKWNYEAARNLESACNLAVERWHFRMLNDKVRNSSFREAIKKKVQAGYRDVLDIGTGTGLLSLFAMEAGADKVYGCDSSPVMASIAGQVLHHHNALNVNIIGKHSTDLSIPEDLCDRVSLVVCEILDCGLLGEHVLDTLLHAWSQLLKPSGTIVPSGATFYVCGVESRYISQKWVLNNFPAGLGLDKYCIAAENDTYDSEDLALVPGGFSKITGIVSPLTINFNNKEELQCVLKGGKDICITLKCTKEGSLDCVAGWFSLSLDEEIAFDTQTDSSVKCWDQAIFPCPYPLRMTSGQQITLLISFQDGHTKVIFPDIETSKQCFTISKNAISLLNDTVYVEALQETARAFYNKVENCNVLDTSPFPVMGLTFLRARSGKDKLVSVCSSPGDQQLVRLLLETVGAEVTFINKYNHQNAQARKPYDIILLSVVETTGELSDYYLAHIEQFRELLKPGGQLLPSQIEVIGQLIESEWTQRVSRVLNSSVTCDYEVASFINRFQAQQQLDFRLNSIGPMDKSEPFQLIKLNLLKQIPSLESKCCIPMLQPGQVDALVFWFNIQLLPENAKTYFSTHSSVHFNTAALLLDLVVSESLQMTSKYRNGCFITRADQ